MIPLLLLTALASPAPQEIESFTPIPSPHRRAVRRPWVTWVTGELMGTDVVFRVKFNPRVAGSAVPDVVVIEPRGGVDGIDFVPGLPEVAVGMPTGIISHYDLLGGAILPDFIPATDLIAAPPAGAGTHPSTIWSSPTHFHYIENQFGFGATSSHRIIRKPWAGGPEEVVYDGLPHGLVNFEGIEVVGGRLYFFAEDPILLTARALMSIGLTPGGLWDGVMPALHIGGLFEHPFGTDGSDELDFDPPSGLLFGTNILNGEVIAFDPFAGMEVGSPGAAHFVDDIQIAGSVGALGALSGSIDGVRSVGDGWLVFTGKAGVIVSLDVFGVLADGADDGDARVLFSMPGVFDFDDLTPVLPRF